MTESVREFENVNMAGVLEVLSTHTRRANGRHGKWGGNLDGRDLRYMWIA